MKRFRYFEATGQIIDGLTGFRYYGNQKLCDLLNDLNDRADRNAVVVFDVEKILRKHEISSLEKLDQILFEQRVW